MAPVVFKYINYDGLTDREREYIPTLLKQNGVESNSLKSTDDRILKREITHIDNISELVLKLAHEQLLGEKHKVVFSFTA
jgi:hypothetical protein